MSDARRLGCVLLLLVNLLVGGALFITGFLPYAPAPAFDQGNETNQSTTVVEARVGKVVLMVIDALRWDFVFPLDESVMKSTSRHVQEMGLVWRAKASVPTVTLPRIKAIISGKAPGFIDVVLNLNSGAMDTDSLVRRARMAGKVVTFFGDDTWLKLFPDSFARSDGVSSFYVNDYTEVDDNVTRHLDAELRTTAANWDMMILHYLGLDHIGHTFGPGSELVADKLKEMDAVVSRVVEALVNNEDDRETLPPLVVICGDHGMSDGGSHGGSSANEVYTPLIFISPLFRHSRPDSFGINDALQVDIAPTIASLMGLNLPSASTGRILPRLVDSLPVDDQWSVLNGNFEQLHRVATKQFGFMPEKCAGVGNQTLSSLKESSVCLQDALLSVGVDYDLYKMFLGWCLVSLSWLVAAVDILAPPDSSSPSNVCQNWCLDPTRTTHVAWKGIFAITGWSFGSYFLCRLVPVFSPSGLCPPHDSGASAITSLVTWCLVGAVFVDLVVKLWAGDTMSSRLQRKKSYHMVILCIPAIHAVTFASTSFIEEEHFTWYHLSTTLVLCLAVRRLIITTSDASSSEWRRCIGRAGLLLALLRLSRSWNQTGDKWAGLPDVGKVLGAGAGSRDWLCGAVLAGLLSIGASVGVSGVPGVCKCLAWACLPLVFGYHVESGGLLGSVGWLSERGIMEARLTFLLLTIGWIAAICDSWSHHHHHHRANKSSDRSTATSDGCLWRKTRIYFVIFAALTGKAHNVPLLAITCHMQDLFFDLVLGSVPHQLLGSSGSGLVAYWVAGFVMASAAFFAQGNSNSLSTVHLASGYVGLRSHVLFLTGPMLVLSTYSHFLLWLLRAGETVLLLLHRHEAISDGLKSSDLFDQRDERATVRMKRSLALAVVWTRGLPFAVYLAVVCFQREHLFVWTVFAPKLLYEGLGTGLCAVLAALVVML